MLIYFNAWFLHDTGNIIFKMEEKSIINIFQSLIVFLSWVVFMLLNCFFSKDVMGIAKSKSVKRGTYSRLHSEANYPLGSACLQKLSTMKR